MSDEVRIVHYLNQFFGGVGGEQEAGIPARFIEGPLGPGKPLEAALGGNGRIVGTIVAGDNYVTENADSSTKVAEIVEMIRASHPKRRGRRSSLQRRPVRHGMRCSVFGCGT
jgi:betaine reductase